MEIDSTEGMTTPAFSNDSLSFGLIVPGGPLRTDFLQTDATKYVLSFSTGAVPLHSIRELVLFCMPNFTLPADHGVLCYWQLSAAQSQQALSGFELLGALTPPSRSSAVFPTGWGEHEQVVQLDKNHNCQVTVGLSIEPLANIQNVNGVEERLQNGKLFIAQKIASDLFNFMQSFDTGTSSGGTMVVPHTIFDRWFKRFTNRFQRDPNFFLKGNDD